MSDFAAMMPAVARHFWGEPNRQHSNAKQLRWGTNGARTVNVEQGTWFDFEANEGGGVLDLLAREHIPDASQWLQEHGYDQGAVNGSGGRARSNRIVASYDYPDETGDLSFQVCRFEPKTFRQRRPARSDDPPDKVRDGWVWNVTGVRRVPFRLPDLIEAVALERRVYIVEGEKDVLTLARFGITATCNPGGVGKWDAAFADYLAGADVIVIPDNDDRGREHAQAIARSLAGTAAQICMLALPGLADKGDVSDWFAAGGTVENFNALVDAAPGWSDDGSPSIDDHAGNTEHFAPQSHSSNLLSYAEMVRLPPPDWLVKDVLPLGATAVLFGESNAFKSFIAIDLACSAALGFWWHGHAVQKGNVVYVASEAAYGIATKRIPAWMSFHNVPTDQRDGIFLRVSPPLLDDPKSLAAFKKDIASVQPVRLICYDVLAGTMRGSERDTDIIAAWVRVVTEIEAAFGCAQLFVTHSPYGDAGRMRGGTHLWGSFSTRLKAEGDREKRTTVLSVERHKDADSAGLRWGFKLEIADIDEFEGETSLVPVKEDGVTTQAKSPKLTGTADEVLRSFKYAVAEGVARKAPASNHIPAGVDVLTTEMWRRYFDKLTPSQGNADTRRKRFERGTDRLLSMRLAAKWGDDWWLTDQGKAVS